MGDEQCVPELCSAERARRWLCEAANQDRGPLRGKHVTVAEAARKLKRIGRTCSNVGLGGHALIF